MRCELEKVATRRKTIFGALQTKLPEDLTVIETGKNFPIKFDSPFYATGSSLKTILRDAGKPGEAVLKEVDPARRYVVVPHATSRTQLQAGELTISAPSYTYLAHELGHALEHEEGLSGKLLHGPAPHYTAMAGGILGPLAGTVVGSLFKKPLYGALAGAGVGGALTGLGHLPMVYREGKASDRGQKLLEAAGASPKELSAAQEAMGKAKSTYVRAAGMESLLGSLIGGVGGAISSMRHH